MKIQFDYDNGRKEKSMAENNSIKDLNVKELYKTNLNVVDFGERLKSDNLTAEEKEFFEKLDDFRSKYKL